MGKLKTALLAAKLRQLTPLVARTRNETKWSSSFDMVQRYFEIKDFISKIESPDLVPFLLAPMDIKKLEGLLKELKKMEVITKQLQNECTTMAEVRDLFDPVIDDYSDIESLLSPTVEIVHQYHFDWAVLKVQNGQVDLMSLEERLTLRPFEVTESLIQKSQNETQEDLSYVQIALLRRSSGVKKASQQYMNLRFLLPTSNICERLFSNSGYALNDRRRGINPTNLESKMCLHMNNDLWIVDEFTNLSKIVI